MASMMGMLSLVIWLRMPIIDSSITKKFSWIFLEELLQNQSKVTLFFSLSLPKKIPTNSLISLLDIKYGVIAICHTYFLCFGVSVLITSSINLGKLRAMSLIISEYFLKKNAHISYNDWQEIFILSVLWSSEVLRTRGEINFLMMCCVLQEGIS